MGRIWCCYKDSQKESSLPHIWVFHLVLILNCIEFGRQWKKDSLEVGYVEETTPFKGW